MPNTDLPLPQRPSYTYDDIENAARAVSQEILPFELETDFVDAVATVYDHLFRNGGQDIAKALIPYGFNLSIEQSQKLNAIYPHVENMAIQAQRDWFAEYKDRFPVRLAIGDTLPQGVISAIVEDSSNVIASYEVKVEREGSFTSYLYIPFEDVNGL